MAEFRSDYDIIKSIIGGDAKVCCNWGVHTKELQIYDVILSFDENGMFRQVWTFDPDEE